MDRSAIHTTEQFKAHPGSVLLATGTAWEGFGRAIRTETDICVVAILDERATKGQRHRRDVLATQRVRNRLIDSYISKNMVGSRVA